MRKFEPTGLRGAHVAVMRLLEDGPCLERDLARTLGLPDTLLTALLEALERERLASRGEHPSDLRKEVLSLSTPGRTRLVAFAVAHEHCDGIKIDDLTDAQRTLYVALLERIAERVIDEEPLP